jgi:hypothetical protein
VIIFAGARHGSGRYRIGINSQVFPPGELIELFMIIKNSGNRKNTRQVIGYPPHL